MCWCDPQKRTPWCENCHTVRPDIAEEQINKTIQMPKEYRKKPVVIEAIQLTPRTIREVYTFINGRVPHPSSAIDSEKWDEYESIVRAEGMKLMTLESDGQTQTATMGDWIIKGVKGEFYPIKDEIFRETYEEVAQIITETEPEQNTAPIDGGTDAREAAFRRYHRERYSDGFMVQREDFEAGYNAAMRIACKALNELLDPPNIITARLAFTNEMRHVVVEETLRRVFRQYEIQPPIDRKVQETNQL